MSRKSEMTNVYLGSFPRVSGDEPFTLLPTAHFVWFSPRERG